MSFEIPDVLAPLWSSPKSEPQPISEQVGDLVDRFAEDGNNGAVGALMRGLALVDRSIVHDRYSDPREWEIVGGALRKAFAAADGKTPDGSTILGLIVDEVERARVDSAEEDDNFKSEPLLHTLCNTHQRDRIWATVWDEERCAAASIVAVVSHLGPEALDRVAHEIDASLEQTQKMVRSARATLESPDADVRQTARQSVLEFLSVFVVAARIQLPVMLERVGWTYGEKDSTEPGIYLGSKSSTDGFWVRANDGELYHVQPTQQDTKTSGVRVDPADNVPEDAKLLVPPHGGLPAGIDSVEVPDTSIKVQLLAANRSTPDAPRHSKQIEVALDPRPASMLSALGQLAGIEHQLYDDAIDSIDAERARVETVLGELDATAPGAASLQKLADTLLFAGRNIYSGLNLLPATELLQRAGVDAAPPADGRARSLSDLAKKSKPGEAYLLVSDGHAAAYMHLEDGRRLVYDSEGIFGVQERACLATYDPYGAPKRTEALDRHYREFFGLIQIPLK